MHPYTVIFSLQHSKILRLQSLHLCFMGEQCR